MMYDEEFYNEPSEFEQQIKEFKSSLLDSVKKEYKDKMERLEKENAELQDVKKRMDEIERNYKRKEQELSWERQNLESKVRRERLSKLMGDLQVELYTVGSKSHKRPKCNKCDENRRIPYTTPLGKETYESCDCSKNIHVYEPAPITLNSFSIRDGKGNAWYKVKEDRSDEWLEYYSDSINGSELITSEEQFESIGYAYKTLFKDIEIAQKYCDYKNNQSKEN